MTVETVEVTTVLTFRSLPGLVEGVSWTGVLTEEVMNGEITWTSLARWQAPTGQMKVDGRVRLWANFIAGPLSPGQSRTLGNLIAWEFNANFRSHVSSQDFDGP